MPSYAERLVAAAEIILETNGKDDRLRRSEVDKIKTAILNTRGGQRTPDLAAAMDIALVVCEFTGDAMPEIAAIMSEGKPC